MLKKMAMGAAAVLLSAGMATAAATKFTEWTKGADEAGEVDGAATFKVIPSRQVMHYTIVLHNLTPNRIYSVMGGDMNGDGFGPVDVASNSGGNLTLTGDKPNVFSTEQVAEGYIFLLDPETGAVRASSFSN